MGMSRLEINVRRLLAKCELMAKEESERDWRLEKFINDADIMIQELHTCENKPVKDALSTYSQRVQFLKGLIEADKITNPVEKAVATQLLPSGPAATDNVSKQIHNKTTTKVHKQLREHLFGEKNDGVRKRQSATAGEDLDVLLKYHHSVQEKIADEMLVLARNMKEQSKLANVIIKNDTASVEKSSELAENNFSNLRKESERLQEHSRSSFKCWLWIMLIAVLVIFINMVLFMKVMRKRT
ncbi:vesicle transport protein USE1 [Nilaparvata lugens]|uniref:vesicle transport protein USE1 n=1 Tax=Nilaparvata lugens TaxID=108931 RepID=UPI000B99AE05|nr:vesicle transport protein USE1 [Nilaparvata lugens]